jgi:hypothetical protein
MPDNPCSELLKDGVYAKYITTQTADKTVDYKTYFKSEKFKSDYKNENIDISIGVVVDGVPIDFGFGKSDTEIAEIQEKIEKSTDFKLTEKFYLNNAETFADKNLLEAYNKCLSEQNKLGFNIRYELATSEITFIVKYVNFGALRNPKLESVYFSNGNKPTYRTLNDNEELEVNSEYSFAYKFESSSKDETFIIDTDLGSQPLKVNLRRRGNYEDNSPVGTIITSYLDWEAFQKITDSNKDSNGTWQSKFSIWSPCDGRQIPNSYLSEITSSTNVPDLRGAFLRGLNVLDAVSEMKGKVNRVNNEQKDIDNGRTVGSFQADSLKKHQHIVSQNLGAYKDQDGPDNAGFLANAYQGNWGNVGSSWEGGEETRPKNVAVYYYIKIN